MAEQNPNMIYRCPTCKITRRERRRRKCHTRYPLCSGPAGQQHPNTIMVPEQEPEQERDDG